MKHAVDNSDLNPLDSRDPSPEEIKKVADSILPVLLADADERVSGLSDWLFGCNATDLGVAMLEGDHAEVGRIAEQFARNQLAVDAEEMAEQWLVDDLTNDQRRRLAAWRPVKYACLGTAYHFAEMGL